MGFQANAGTPRRPYEAPPDYWRRFFELEASRPTPPEKIATRLGLEGLHTVLLGLTPLETFERDHVRIQVLTEEGRLLFELRDDPEGRAKMTSRFQWWGRTFGDVPPLAYDGTRHLRGAAVLAAVPPGGTPQATLGFFALMDDTPRVFCVSGYTCLFLTDEKGRTILYSPARVTQGPPVNIGMLEAMTPAGDLVESLSYTPSTRTWEVLDPAGNRLADVSYLRYHPRVGTMRRLRRFSVRTPSPSGNWVLPLFHVLLHWTYDGISQHSRQVKREHADTIARLSGVPVRGATGSAPVGSASSGPAPRRR